MMSPLLFLLYFYKLLVVIIAFRQKIDKFPEMAFAVQSSTKKRVARMLFCSEASYCFETSGRFETS